ncbi:MAG TPA: hypothetical protein VGN63_18725 [Flavisolibacter sp.]|nr:hypothetical protein [Flavisolibacter sp.]
MKAKKEKRLRHAPYKQTKMTPVKNHKDHMTKISHTTEDKIIFYFIFGHPPGSGKTKIHILKPPAYYHSIDYDTKRFTGEICAVHYC